MDGGREFRPHHYPVFRDSPFVGAAHFEQNLPLRQEVKAGKNDLTVDLKAAK
jgi:hypothetical protein